MKKKLIRKTWKEQGTWEVPNCKLKPCIYSGTNTQKYVIFGNGGGGIGQRKNCWQESYAFKDQEI